MRQTLCGWLVFFLFAFIFFPISSEASRAGLTLKPPFYKFNDVRPGKKYPLKVKITNSSSKAVTLSNLKSDCDCVGAEIPNPVLNPNSSVTMTVVYHPAPSDRGFKSYKVRFSVLGKDFVNKPQRFDMSFPFTATVIPEVSFEPMTLKMDYVLFGNSRAVTSTIVPDAKVYPKWKFLEVRLNTRGLEAKCMPSVKAGTYNVILQAPATLSPGKYEGNLQIYGRNGKDETFWEYPYSVLIASVWTVQPKPLILAELDPKKAEKWKSTTQILHAYRNPFKIVKIEGVPDWLKYQVKPFPAGGYLLEWKIDGGKLKKAGVGKLPEKFTVTTNLPGEDMFSIPVAGKWPTEKTVPTPTVAQIETKSKTGIATVIPTSKVMGVKKEISNKLMVTPTSSK